MTQSLAAYLVDTTLMSIAFAPEVFESFEKGKGQGKVQTQETNHQPSFYILQKKTNKSIHTRVPLF